MRDLVVGCCVRRSPACFSSKLSAMVAVAVLAISATACSQKGGLSDEVEGASPAALNSNPQITNFGVYAQNSATLRDRVALSGGDVGVSVKGTGPFLVTGYELALHHGRVQGRWNLHAHTRGQQLSYRRGVLRVRRSKPDELVPAMHTCHQHEQLDFKEQWDRVQRRQCLHQERRVHGRKLRWHGV